jgi:hypothetical protein
MFGDFIFLVQKLFVLTCYYVVLVARPAMFQCNYCIGPLPQWKKTRRFHTFFQSLHSFRKSELQERYMGFKMFFAMPSFRSNFLLRSVYIFEIRKTVSYTHTTYVIRLSDLCHICHAIQDRLTYFNENHTKLFSGNILRIKILKTLVEE